MSEKQRFTEADLKTISTIEHIRHRPEMYVGSRGLRGLAQHVINPVKVILRYRVV